MRRGSGERSEACQKQANGMSGMTRMFGGGFHLTAAETPERGKQGACDCYRRRGRGGEVAHHVFARFYRNTPPWSGTRRREQGA